MPSATARDFQRVARLLGFILTRQKGSHARWNHPDGRGVMIPVHGSAEIGGTLFFNPEADWNFPGRVPEVAIERPLRRFC